MEDFVADRSSVHALFVDTVGRYDIYGAGRWTPEIACREHGRLLGVSQRTALIADANETRLVGAGKARPFAAGSFSIPCDGGFLVASPGKSETELTRVTSSEGAFHYESSTVACVLSAAVPTDGVLLGLAVSGKLVTIEKSRVEDCGTALSLHATRDGPLVETSKGLRIATAEGRVEIPSPHGNRFAVDTVTGNLYAWSDVVLEQLDPTTRVWKRVRFKR